MIKKSNENPLAHFSKDLQKSIHKMIKKLEESMVKKKKERDDEKK